MDGVLDGQYEIDIESDNLCTMLLISSSACLVSGRVNLDSETAKSPEMENSGEKHIPLVVEVLLILRTIQRDENLASEPVNTLA